MNTRAVTRQPPPAAQNPPVQEDDRSEDDDSGSDTPKTQSRQEKQPMVTDETAIEPLPSSRESSREPPDLEGKETDIETVQETISALKKEITNLTYKIV